MSWFIFFSACSIVINVFAAGGRETPRLIVILPEDASAIAGCAADRQCIKVRVEQDVFAAAADSISNEVLIGNVWLKRVHSSLREEGGGNDVQVYKV
jgi:hypothetical protein